MSGNDDSEAVWFGCGTCVGGNWTSINFHNRLQAEALGPPDECNHHRRFKRKETLQNLTGTRPKAIDAAMLNFHDSITNVSGSDSLYIRVCVNGRPPTKPHKQMNRPMNKEECNHSKAASAELRRRHPLKRTQIRDQARIKVMVHT